MACQRADGDGLRRRPACVTAPRCTLTGCEGSRGESGPAVCAGPPGTRPHSSFLQPGHSPLASAVGKHRSHTGLLAGRAGETAKGLSRILALHHGPDHGPESPLGSLGQSCIDTFSLEELGFVRPKQATVSCDCWPGSTKPLWCPRLAQERVWARAALPASWVTSCRAPGWHASG